MALTGKAVAASKPGSSLVPPGVDLVTLLSVMLGFAVLYVPTYLDLMHTIWASDEQGHGPIILAVSLWLLYQRRHAIAALDVRPARLPGWLLIGFALLLYLFGRTQGVLLFEVGSQIPLIAGMLLLLIGPQAVRVAAFPLFFLLFMIPLPAPLVVAVTGPLKAAVSNVAERIMYAAGYPIGRTGVVLTVGPYQLLVADACAGLNSMFTLEALGLLYMNLMNYTSVARNVTLAILIIPISFAANVVRVLILILVTYHFGDAAGQGFVHGFAGMVLFMVALVLMLITDSLISRVVPSRRAGAAA